MVTNGPSPDNDYCWGFNIEIVFKISQNHAFPVLVGLRDNIKISDKYLIMTELSFFPLIRIRWP